MNKKRLLQNFLNLLFPPDITCDICRGELWTEEERKHRLCNNCFGQLRLVRDEKMLYGNITVYSCYVYDGQVRNIVIDYKDDDRTHYAFLIASSLAEQYRKMERFDTVAFIPCGKKNRLRRGYDPMYHVAKEFCSMTHVPLSEGLKRKADSTDQANVDYEDRSANIKDCFVGEEKEFFGKKVLLLDDIVTSGATMREGAEAILRAGATKVSGLTFCRA